MKINFYKVHNDFGSILPETYAEFYASTDNEIKPHHLRNRYNCGNKFRSYEMFKEEYAEFVKTLAPASYNEVDEHDEA